ncbi:MAG TPA: polyprenyl diphosphate synthase [Gemmatimonadaceae bacterium]|nr:polyprenyl diphosphate synthase [Gemmatimonadaceae bacterium]
MSTPSFGRNALPRHVAIIMDGNGRWATARGRSRSAGHMAGAKAARRIIESARRLELETLTLYAFSSDNWQRPASEIGTLMGLFRRYLLSETPTCVENGVRLSIIGRRDRLAPELLRAIDTAEQATAGACGMLLRVAIDYSSRDLIARAATACSGEASRDEFAGALARVMHAGADAPDVDLLLRTGGEQRLSDFLLWECAYAELVFTPRMWPEMHATDLEEALAEYARRERRYGTVPVVLAEAAQG